MRITFWGVRGSIPTPGPDTVEFGGNTSCVEIRAAKANLIFDGGTGLRLLGKSSPPRCRTEARHFSSAASIGTTSRVFRSSIRRSWRGTRFTCTEETTSRGRWRRRSPGKWTTRAFPSTCKEMGAKMTFNDLVEGAGARNRLR